MKCKKCRRGKMIDTDPVWSHREDSYITLSEMRSVCSVCKCHITYFKWSFCNALYNISQMWCKTIGGWKIEKTHEMGQKYQLRHYNPEIAAALDKIGADYEEEEEPWFIQRNGIPYTKPTTQVNQYLDKAMVTFGNAAAIPATNMTLSYKI